MTDISALFDDVLFPVDLKHPITQEPVGITFHVAPFQADATADWWIRTTATMEHMKAGEAGISLDRMAEIDAMAIIKRCAASVRKWEWNGNSFGKLGADPACTLENKMTVLSDHGASWIVHQVFTGVEKAGNFTKKPDAN